MGEMRISFIARNFPPIIGGAENLNYDLSLRFKHKVKLKLIANKGNKHSLIFYFSSLFKVLFDKDIDVIFLSDAVLSPMIPVFKIFRRKPVVIKIHGLDITYNNTLYQFCIPKFINMADKIICISRAAKNECLKRKIVPEKCSVISIGIDRVEYDFNKDQAKKIVSKKLKMQLDQKKVLLSVGRLVERKGFHWFIRSVIPKLSEKRNDFVYLVVGKGPYEKKIMGLMQEKKLEDKVKLLGHISKKLLKEVFEASDIFIMPNVPVKGDMEGFGIVILEANKYKTPVLVSDLEGMTDAVQKNMNGFLIKPLDSEAFVEPIIKLLENNKEREMMGEKAQQFVFDKYNWNKIIQKYLNEFSRAYALRNNN